MDKSSLKITELPALSVASENGFIPIAQVKEENDTYKVTLKKLRESILFENAYSDTASGVANTVSGDTFFVYTDATKEHVQGWVNAGSGATPLLNGEGEQITYGTYALLNKALKDKGAIVQWVYNGGLSNGGEQTFTVPLTGNISVQEVYVDGLRQFKDVGFELVTDETLSFKLATPVKENQTVVAICFGSDDVEKVNEAFLATYTGPSGASNIGTLTGKNIQLELNDRFTKGEMIDPNITKALAFGRGTPLSTKIQTLNDFFSAQIKNIWEYAGLITNKTDPDDPETWDWAPAIQAAINDALKYRPVKSVTTSSYFVGITLYFPGGVYPIKSGLTVTMQGTGTGGTFQTCLRIIGDGMSASIIQTAADNIDALKVTRCRVIMENIGFRANSKYNRGIVLGDATTWLPAQRCLLTNVGTYGFAKGLVSELAFDSIFIGLNIQSMTDMKDTTQASAGIEISVYSGAGNNGTTGDDSNQLTFINCAVETATANNCTMVRIIGLSKSYPHHAINWFGGHIETHNRNAKCLSMIYAAHCAFYGVVFSQNGNETVTPVPVAYLENTFNVLFSSCRLVTNNAQGTYSDTNGKLVQITQGTMNIGFDRCYFNTAYAALGSYNRNVDIIVDYSTATARIRSFQFNQCILNDFTFKAFSTRSTISNTTLLSREWTNRVDDNGVLIFSYINDITGATAPTDYITFSNAGDISALGKISSGSTISSGGSVTTASDINIGINSTNTTTKGVYFYTSGDQTTVMASMTADSVGRLYLNAISNSIGFVINSSGMQPKADNTHAMGASSFRFTTVYATNGVSSTSDATLKDDLRDRTSKETHAFAEIAQLPSVWKWKEEACPKGDEGKLHSGPTVQAAIEIMEKYDLDWKEYSCFIADKSEEGETRYGLNKEELNWWCFASVMDLLVGGNS